MTNPYSDVSSEIVSLAIKLNEHRKNLAETEKEQLEERINRAAVIYITSKIYKNISVQVEYIKEALKDKKAVSGLPYFLVSALYPDESIVSADEGKIVVSFNLSGLGRARLDIIVKPNDTIEVAGIEERAFGPFNYDDHLSLPIDAMLKAVMENGVRIFQEKASK